MKTALKQYVAQGEQLYRRHQAIFPPFFFLSGFFFDVFTLGRIDDLSNILMQGLYLSLSTFMIYLEFSDFKDRKFDNKFLSLVSKYHDEVFHFLLGSLLSAFALFFFKSASLANSFLFILLFLTLLIINEFEAFQKMGKAIRFVLLQLCFTCFFILIIPVMVGKVGPWIFTLSIFLSILTLGGFYYFFINKKQLMTPEFARKTLVYPGSALVIFFLLFYFLRIIPPVPLSLEKIGIYHKVEKEYPKYHLYHERPWYRFWETGDQKFYARKGDKVFVFLSVFSPGGFEDIVVLHWMKKVRGEYKTSDKVRMAIKGGRGKGYRGLSFKKNYTEGDYRILVETSSGLEIGRINLEIIKVPENEEGERVFKMVTDH